MKKQNSKVSQQKDSDIRYRVSRNFFEDESKKVGEYYVLKSNFIEGSQYLTVKINDATAKVYTPELAFILLSNELPVRNMKNKKNHLLNSSKLFMPPFIKGFLEGVKHFKEWIQHYPAFDCVMVKDLHYNYFHANHRPFMDGWVFVKSKFPGILTHNEIYDYGFYSGIVSEVDALVIAHPGIFNDSSQCRLIENGIQQDHEPDKPDGVKAPIANDAYRRIEYTILECRIKAGLEDPLTPNELRKNSLGLYKGYLSLNKKSKSFKGNLRQEEKTEVIKRLQGSPKALEIFMKMR